jgi:hypothetical protein
MFKPVQCASFFQYTTSGRQKQREPIPLEPVPNACRGRPHGSTAAFTADLANDADKKRDLCHPCNQWSFLLRLCGFALTWVSVPLRRCGSPRNSPGIASRLRRRPRPQQIFHRLRQIFANLIKQPAALAFRQTQWASSGIDKAACRLVRIAEQPLA